MILSVIIPAYNRAHCIQRALGSVALQHEGGLEIIIGDDASTDETVGAALRFLPEVRIVRLPINSGAAAARNAAMQNSGGEFLAFLDSDDEWLPGKLERQLLYLREHPECAVCATGHLLASGDGHRSEFPGRNPDDWRRSLHSAQSFHGASTPVIRRSVLGSVGLQDEELRVLEDWDWMLRISQKYPIHVLPEILAVIHENAPSDPEQTVRSMEHFLAKHRQEFLRYGGAHARKVISQHEENTARTLLRNGLSGEGAAMLWKSWRHAPLRNPALLAAFPLAAMDALSGTKFLAGVLATRSRRRIT